MRYPEVLKKGDYIGVTAPSAGICDENDILIFKNAKKRFGEEGYNVIETPNIIRKGIRSCSAKNRAKELIDLWNNDDIKSIICLKGGDFLCEVLDELDFDKIKNSKLKWIQGYSDITNLGFVFTTNLDFATIYGPNFKTFGMNEWHESLKNSIKLSEKKVFIQDSYEKCESIDDKYDDNDGLYDGYRLETNVKWINLEGEDEIKFKGRAIGGCFDVIVNLIGTKYDKTKEFINKYKNDGIVWFFDVFEKSTSQLFINLWQMKRCGYFENCNGIIFGRPLFIREENGMNFLDSIRESIGDLKIPIICDADIGHIAPQIPIVNGGIIEVQSKDGKGSIKIIFE